MWGKPLSQLDTSNFPVPAQQPNAETIGPEEDSIERASGMSRSAEAVRFRNRQHRHHLPRQRFA